MKKFVLTLLAGAVAVLAPGAALAQTYNVVAPVVAPGETTSVTLGPFDAGTNASGTLFSDPIPLGTARVNSAGFATFNVKIPANFTGTHHIEATGVLNGQPKTYKTPPFTVRPAAATTGTASKGLARTGSDSNTLPIALGGAAVVLAGAGLVVVAKRRSNEGTAA